MSYHVWVEMASMIDDASGVIDEDPRLVWRRHRKHYIVLTTSGKPVYSRYGDESVQTSLAAVLQAIVSKSLSSGDPIQQITAGDALIVFLRREPLYFIAVSRTREPAGSLIAALELLHGHILFALTAKFRANLARNPAYDMRSLLGGTESAMQALIQLANRSLAPLLDATPVLPLSRPTREALAGLLQGLRVPDVVFALLLAGERLVAHVAPSSREYALAPFDIALLSNFVVSSTSLRTSEAWTPVCLPRFNDSGFLHAYIVFLSLHSAPAGGGGGGGGGDDSGGVPSRRSSAADASPDLGPAHAPAPPPPPRGRAAPPPAHAGSELCLILVSSKTTEEHFHALTTGKTSLVKAILSSKLLQKLENARATSYETASLKVEHLLHFVYVWRPLSQMTSPAWSDRFASHADRKCLLRRYHAVHAQLLDVAALGGAGGGGGSGSGSGSGSSSSREHGRCQVTESTDVATVVGILLPEVELLCAFDPLVSGGIASALADRVLKLLRRQHDDLLIMTPFTW